MATAGTRLFFTKAPDQSCYNIKAVCKRTGIPTPTLRAWERRYGLPHPVRSAQGYRLYSERDIAIVTWLQQRLKHGTSIAQAVDQFNQLIDTEPLISHGGVTAYASAIQQVDSPVAGSIDLSVLPVMPYEPSNSRFFDAVRSPSVLRHELIVAMLIGNKLQINNVISESLALYTLDTTLLTIIHGAVQTVRDQSLADTQVNIAETVGITEIELRLQNLSQFSPAIVPDRNTVMLIGFGEERTAIERLIIELLLRRKSIAVVAMTVDSVSEVYDSLALPVEQITAGAQIGLVAWYTNNPSCLIPVSDWPRPANIKNGLSMAWGSIAPEPYVVADEIGGTLVSLGTTLRDIIQYIIISLFNHNVPQPRAIAAGRIRTKL
jgi:DNA-binding transcriptional MerR regulator